MNITLIGMAGAGKSAVGKKLAEELNYEFIDIGEIIEKESGLKLQEIIDKYGEEKFLETEEKAVLELDDINNCVISPGGSIVYSEKATSVLKNISKIIFLDAPLNLLESRIRNYELRGLVGLRNKNLKEIFEERRPLYEKWAGVRIEVKGNMSVSDIVKKIIKNFDCHSEP